MEGFSKNLTTSLTLQQRTEYHEAIMEKESTAQARAKEAVVLKQKLDEAVGRENALNARVVQMQQQIDNMVSDDDDDDDDEQRTAQLPLKKRRPLPEDVEAPPSSKRIKPNEITIPLDKLLAFIAEQVVKADEVMEVVVEDQGSKPTLTVRRTNFSTAHRAYLDRWFSEHIMYPYPNSKEKETICRETKLTKKQITKFVLALIYFFTHLNLLIQTSLTTL